MRLNGRSSWPACWLHAMYVLASAVLYIVVSHGNKFSELPAQLNHQEIKIGLLLKSSPTDFFCYKLVVYTKLV